MLISINDIISTPNAISHSDGVRLYNYLNAKNKNKIELSFEGINRVSTAFLNACIGKMIVDGSFKSSFINREQTKEIFLKKIDSVTENANNYPKYSQIVRDATLAY